MGTFTTGLIVRKSRLVDETISSVGHKKILSLDYVATLLGVYRAGSFSGAARQLGVSQPTVTSHIQALENHFGERLFIRTADGALPTAATHEFVAQIESHVDQIDRVMRGDSRGAARMRSISLGGPREFISMCVWPAISEISDRLPRIEVTLGESQPLLASLLEGRLDLVISTVRPQHEDLHAWLLADEEFWLVGSPKMGLQGRPFSEINAAPIVAYNSGLAIIRRYWNRVFKAEPRFDPNIVVPDLQSLKAAAVAGLGITVLPSYLVTTEVAMGELVRLDETEESPINTVFLVASKAVLAARPHLGFIANLLAHQIKTLDFISVAQN